MTDIEHSDGKVLRQQPKHVPNRDAIEWHGTVWVNGSAYQTVRRHRDNAQAQVQFLVDFLQERGLLEDGLFTFPDGDYIEASA